MVVLATCFGARMMRLAGQHPFAGSASALVAGGLAAVVGMQFPVSEHAASEFTAAFYGKLAEGRSLEEALTEGRMRIFTTDRGSFEWASPVLFLRSRTGDVLDLQTSQDSREDSIEHPERAAMPSALLEGGSGPPGVGRDYNRAERDLTVVGRDNIRADRDVVIGRRPRKW